MREGKRRSTARRRERSDVRQDSFPNDLSEVTKQAFEAGEKSDPDLESSPGALESEGLCAARPLSNPTGEVVSPKLSTKQLDDDEPSGPSKEQTLSLITESPTPPAEIQTPPDLPYHGQHPGIRGMSPPFATLQILLSALERARPH